MGFEIVRSERAFYWRWVNSNHRQRPARGVAHAVKRWTSKGNIGKTLVSYIASILCFVFCGLYTNAEETKTFDGELKIERYSSIDNVCAWPNLTKLPDGTLAAVIVGKPSHGQMVGEIECWASTDGQFWEKCGHPAPNEPNTNRMNVAAGLAGNGDLMVLCSGWTDEKQSERPKQADENQRVSIMAFSKR
jgi:hypothetical protein